MKSNRMIWLGHVANKGKNYEDIQHSACETQKTIEFGESRHNFVDTLKLSIMESGF
jgi:hypothetical protein